MQLLDQVAIVTGASQGIGFAAMKALSNAGAKVIGLARNPEAIAKAIEVLNPKQPGDMMGIPADVRSEAEVQQAIAQILTAYGKIDILINAAGVSMRGKELVQEVDLDEWKRILDTNLTGTFLMSREVLPAMVERNSGYIINILSTAAYRSSAGDSIYAASKFGARALTEAMIEANRATGIRVSSISPGAVDTNIWSHKNRVVTEEERATMLRADDIANIMMFLLSQPSAVHIDNITVTPWNRKRG